jgi:hypothetical protein
MPLCRPKNETPRRSADHAATNCATVAVIACSIESATRFGAAEHAMRHFKAQRDKPKFAGAGPGEKLHL